MGAQLGGERAGLQFVFAEAGVSPEPASPDVAPPFSNGEWRRRTGVGRLPAIVVEPNHPPMSTPTPGLQARHQQALAEGRFLIQRCGACAKHIYFPRVVCPHCGALEPELVPTPGLGTVHAVATPRRKPDAGGDFNVVLVDLDEGVRVMSRVEGLAPADVRIGLRVKARVEVKDGQGLVVFDVAEGQ